MYENLRFIEFIKVKLRISVEKNVDLDVQTLTF